MKTENQIKSMIKDLKKEENSLYAELKTLHKNSCWQIGKINCRLTGIFSELCTLEWVLSNKKMSIGTIAHNKIMNTFKRNDKDIIKHPEKYKTDKKKLKKAKLKICSCPNN